MQEEKYTSIRITVKTRDDLKAKGKKGESYDDIIQKMLKG